MVNEKPFKLDMPFKEALRRFVQTDEKEIPQRKKLKRGKKAGDAKPPAKSEDQSTSDAGGANGRARTRRGET